MYAVSNGKRLKYDLKEESAVWKTARIDRIQVKDGKVEIGFGVEAAAHAFCNVDDVTLVRTK